MINQGTNTNFPPFSCNKNERTFTSAQSFDETGTYQYQLLVFSCNDLTKNLPPSQFITCYQSAGNMLVMLQEYASFLGKAYEDGIITPILQASTSVEVT